MLVLSQTTDKIQVTLGANVATNQLQCVTAFRDITQTPTYVAGRSVANTNNTTAVDLIASPAANTQRVIDYIGVFNRDTASATVTIQFDANGATFIVWRGTIAAGEHLEYENGKGWTVKTAGGLIKTLQSQSIVTIAQNENVTILANDVVNNNAVANTMQDVTGLSFPVVAGEVYWFRFDIMFSVDATTTGSRWSINGPGSPTSLMYRSEYSLATSVSNNPNLLNYDLPATANTSSSSLTSNRALIEGCIVPSTNGNVIARFASEVANAPVTAKAGSRVLWQRTL